MSDGGTGWVDPRGVERPSLQCGLWFLTTRQTKTTCEVLSYGGTIGGTGIGGTLLSAMVAPFDSVLFV